MEDLAQVHRPDPIVAPARTMIEAPQPMSCRRGTEVQGVSRHSVWRWQMAINGALTPEPHGVSGMGLPPARPSKPPGTTAPAVASLSAAGRFDHSASGRLAILAEEAPPGNGSCRPPAFEAIADAGETAIAGTLLPVMAPDAVLCTDGHATYERIAKDERIPHFALNAGRRSKQTPHSHHVNTVNALIGRFRTFMQPFCGPASKNLAVDGRWPAARDNASRDYADVLGMLLNSSPRANTVS